MRVLSLVLCWQEGAGNHFVPGGGGRAESPFSRVVGTHKKKKTRFHRLLWSETLNRRAHEATGPPEGGGGSAVSRQRWTATKSDTASICSTCRINTEGCCKFPKQTTCSQWEELKILRARRRKRTREFHLDVCL